MMFLEEGKAHVERERLVFSQADREVVPRKRIMIRVAQKALSGNLLPSFSHTKSVGQRCVEIGVPAMTGMLSITGDYVRQTPVHAEVLG